MQKPALGGLVCTCLPIEGLRASPAQGMSPCQIPPRRAQLAMVRRAMRGVPSSSRVRTGLSVGDAGQIPHIEHAAGGGSKGCSTYAEASHTRSNLSTGPETNLLAIMHEGW